MTDPYVIVLLTLAGVAVLKLLVLLVLGGGSFARLGLAWTAFRRVLGDQAVADKVRSLLTPPPPEPKKPPRLSGEPVRLLALLQRDGRLLDFLLEDLTQADDSNVVAAVRDIHPKVRQSLQEHVTLEPIIAKEEGTQVEVPPGFDPSAIQLTGNVTGQPPFRGTLLHPGVRVKSYNLPAPPAGQDDLVLTPAKVELP